MAEKNLSHVPQNKIFYHVMTCIIVLVLFSLLKYTPPSLSSRHFPSTYLLFVLILPESKSKPKITHCLFLITQCLPQYTPPPPFSSLLIHTLWLDFSSILLPLSLHPTITCDAVKSAPGICYYRGNTFSLFAVESICGGAQNWGGTTHFWLQVCSTELVRLNIFSLNFLEQFKHMDQTDDMVHV